MHQALSYSFKIWFTTILLGAVCCLVLFYSPLGDVRYDEVAVTLFMSVFISIFYSIPCFLCFSLSAYVLYEKIYNLTLLKLSISAVAIVLCFLLFLGLGFMGWQNQFPVLAFIEYCYPTIVLAGIWFYKLEPNKDAANRLKD